MAGSRNFHVGDKVIVRGIPYSYSYSKAKIVSEPEKTKEGDQVVGVTYRYIGDKKYKIVNLEDVIRLSKGKKMKISKPAIVTGIILAFVGIVVLWFAGNYNSLVQANNAVKNSSAKIDTELTRRYDLIDNIVQSVQGSQAQESDVFGKIADARKIGGSQTDQTSDTAQQANQTIDTQIALLPRLQENYPELRSNDQVTRLIQELQGTNNTIRDKRNEYNNTVTNYNNNITSFPKNIFANVFNFKPAKLYEANQQERVNPKVELDRAKN